MAKIEVTSDRDDGKVVVHAPSKVIERLANAFSLMLPADSYAIFRSEHGAGLLASQTDFDAVLAANPELKKQFARDTAADAAKSSMKI